MDLPLHLRVIWRFKLLVFSGLLLAAAPAFLYAMAMMAYPAFLLPPTDEREPVRPPPRLETVR